ncbi:MAG: DUF5337 domain-containing protein [Mangrovicoccus sp.]|nr:DUF5337 domain-containing protein [Mangrovicoccus sp.]
MAEPTLLDKQLARRARLVALVLVATMVLWLGLQWLGGALGLPARYVFLADFAAIGAFVWALFVTWQIQRRRRDASQDKRA